MRGFGPGFLTQLRSPITRGLGGAAIAAALLACGEGEVTYPNSTQGPSDVECVSESSETRVRYADSSVPFGATCNPQTQERSCVDDSWGAWSGTFAHESCSVMDAASCGETPHGGVQTRLQYRESAVPYGTTCISESQERMCSDGLLGAWTGTFTYDSCIVLDAASCGALPHGSSETRVRYASSSVGPEDTCASEIQSRTCDNGELSDWSGTFSEPSCVVLGFVSCGDIPHLGTQQRTRYASESVAFGDACISEQQTRLCNNGTFGDWSGTFTATSCGIRDPLACEGVAHGQQQERLRYAASAVPYGSECQAENQIRTCDNGAWTDWSGTFAWSSCQVSNAASCGPTPHGGSEARTQYLSSTVPFGGACVSEAQTRTCNDGTWGPWSGSFAFGACAPLPPASCDGVSHNGTQTRVHYAAPVAGLGSACQSEVQTRVCLNGTWAAWTGTYLYPGCTLPAVTKATFSDPGQHPFVVPAGVTQVLVIARGAGGGNASGAGGFGGWGGRVESLAGVTAGSTLTVIVGKAGDAEAGSCKNDPLIHTLDAMGCHGPTVGGRAGFGGWLTSPQPGQYDGQPGAYAGGAGGKYRYSVSGVILEQQGAGGGGASAVMANGIYVVVAGGGGGGGARGTGGGHGCGGTGEDTRQPFTGGDTPTGGGGGACVGVTQVVGGGAAGGYTTISFDDSPAENGAVEIQYILAN